MAVDLKYGKVTAEFGDRAHGSVGVPLNDSDEPVFILRAQDNSALALLERYRNLHRGDPAREEFHAQIGNVIDAFAEWQEAHSDLVKVPD